MSRSIRIFSSEYRPSAEDTFSPASYLELFVELRRLGKERFLTKVSEFEDVGTALGGSTNETRGFEFLESLVLEVRAEKLLDFATNILRRVNKALGHD